MRHRFSCLAGRPRKASSCLLHLWHQKTHQMQQMQQIHHRRSPLLWHETTHEMLRVGRFSKAVKQCEVTQTTCCNALKRVATHCFVYLCVTSLCFTALWTSGVGMQEMLEMQRIQDRHSPHRSCTRHLALSRFSLCNRGVTEV